MSVDVMHEGVHTCGLPVVSRDVVDVFGFVGSCRCADVGLWNVKLFVMGMRTVLINFVMGTCDVRDRIIENYLKFRRNMCSSST